VYIVAEETPGRTLRIHNERRPDPDTKV
jgi:hypothetical protein